MGRIGSTERNSSNTEGYLMGLRRKIYVRQKNDLDTYHEKRISLHSKQGKMKFLKVLCVKMIFFLKVIAITIHVVKFNHIGQ